jgi:hypothetical protein
MVGERREIAKSVVGAILDTLGNNDFVNVYRFSDTTEELVPCFKDMLVQVKTHSRLCTCRLFHCGLFVHIRLKTFNVREI